MKRGEYKRYMGQDQARKAAAKRSLFADLNGEFSQYEVRKVGSSFIAGPDSDELRAMGGTIIAQYAGGYFLDPRDNPSSWKTS